MATVWVSESPVSMIAGESITFSLEWQGASTVSSPTITAYLNGSDVSSDILSGNNTASGNVQVLKTITARAEDVPGKYVINIQAVVDGNTEIKKLEIPIVSVSDEQ